MKMEAEIVDNLLMNSNPNTHFFSMILTIVSLIYIHLIANTYVYMD